MPILRDQCERGEPFDGLRKLGRLSAQAGLHHVSMATEVSREDLHVTANFPGIPFGGGRCHGEPARDHWGVYFCNLLGS